MKYSKKNSFFCYSDWYDDQKYFNEIQFIARKHKIFKQIYRFILIILIYNAIQAAVKITIHIIDIIKIIKVILLLCIGIDLVYDFLPLSSAFL